jgi:peptide/nickel transport system permease protein
MLRYVIKRLLLMIPTLFGAAVLIFLLMRTIPGDICYLRLAAGGGSVVQDVLDNCRRELGLDQSKWVQFYAFIKGLVTLDFGKSMWTNRPII